MIKLLKISVFIFYSYDIVLQSDCTPLPSTEDYMGDVYMVRRANGEQDDRFLVAFWSHDALTNDYDLPTSLQEPGKRYY